MTMDKQIIISAILISACFAGTAYSQQTWEKVEEPTAQQEEAAKLKAKADNEMSILRMNDRLERVRLVTAEKTAQYVSEKAKADAAKALAETEKAKAESVQYEARKQELSIEIAKIDAESRKFWVDVLFKLLDKGFWIAVVLAFGGSVLAFCGTVTKWTSGGILGYIGIKLIPNLVAKIKGELK